MSNNTESDLRHQIEVLQSQMNSMNSLDKHLEEEKPKKTQGIGATWGAITNAITRSSNTVSTLATAGEAIAAQAERQAQISKIEGSKELLDAVGLEGLTGVEAIIAAEKVLKMLRG